MSQAITLGDLATLPPTLNGRQTAEILGMSYWSLLEQRKAGTCIVAPLVNGRCLRWPTAAVLRAVGIDLAAYLNPEVSDGQGTTPGRSPNTSTHHSKGRTSHEGITDRPVSLEPVPAVDPGP